MQQKILPSRILQLFVTSLGLSRCIKAASECKRLCAQQRVIGYFAMDTVLLYCYSFALPQVRCLLIRQPSALCSKTRRACSGGHELDKLSGVGQLACSAHPFVLLGLQLREQLRLHNYKCAFTALSSDWR